MQNPTVTHLTAALAELGQVVQTVLAAQADEELFRVQAETAAKNYQAAAQTLVEAWAALAAAQAAAETAVEEYGAAWENEK